ncbi:MAG TPA: ribbon-helix-helix protein, CopG family [Gemmatimonadaceae bacterium]|jgi:hypothetical protein|nr:ribbon-helix-helix protein, CopG family [Gemmatimonadaceae bacterium]
MPSDPRKRAVREPIQVYLARPDRELLDRLAEQTGLSRAEILRRGLRRVGAELLADEHPAIRFLDEITRSPWPPDMPNDVGERHDDYLTGQADE